MEIVSLDKIPKLEDIIDTPVDNLMRVYKVCLDMENLCNESNGVGLAAAQVGIPWKLFVVNRDGKYTYFINCEYTPLVDVNQKHLQSVEGCLSLKNPDGSSRAFLVERYPKINVKGKMLCVGQDLSLQDFDINFEDPNDVYTIVMQHEIDHQKGILISSIGKEMELWRA